MSLGLGCLFGFHCWEFCCFVRISGTYNHDFNGDGWPLHHERCKDCGDERWDMPECEAKP